MADNLSETVSRSSAASDLSKRTVSAIESVPLPAKAPINPPTAGETFKKKPVAIGMADDKDLRPEPVRRASELKDFAPKPSVTPVERGPNSAEMESLIEKVVQAKVEAAKQDIMLLVREEHRNLHVELIRQFEIQKEAMATLLDQKTLENSLYLAEIERLREELAYVRRSQFN